MATRVLPSPVFISAILPSWSTLPPMSCTSKWRMPSVRMLASRTSAKASGRTSSSLRPFWTCSFHSAVSRGISSVRSAFMRGSSSFTRTTMGARRLSSRSFFVPMTLRSIQFSIVPSLASSARGSYPPS